MNKKNGFILLTTLITLILMLIATIYMVVTLKYSVQKETVETISMDIADAEEKPLEVVLENKNDDSEPEISIENLDDEIIEENINLIENGCYIKVNCEANVVTVYTKDANGDYSVPVKAMICSTGKATPKSGRYKTKGRYRWISLFGNVYGQYSVQIVGNILFHSVPYTQNRNPGSLEYWEYDKLGTSASMGCVRLQIKDAKWIYDNMPAGTVVEFYSDSNPGPLGKPEIEPISDNEGCRNWDPTDPDENNPWRN